MAARSTMSLDARLTIATHMLSPERGYGQASQLARLYQVSRQAVYWPPMKFSSTRSPFWAWFIRPVCI